MGNIKKKETTLYYLRAPYGDEPKYLDLLRDAIVYLGKKHHTIRGSDQKNGIVYLRSKISGANNTQIKLMLRSSRSIIRRPADPKYVFKMSVIAYSKALEIIIDELKTCKQEKLKKRVLEAAELIKNASGNGASYTDILVLDPMVGLNVLQTNGRTQQIRDAAQCLYDEIHSIDERII